MALNFNKFSQQGNEFMADLAKALGREDDRERAGRILVSTLHTLRNQLSLEESLQLIDQFPMFLKAVYVLNWKPHGSKKKIRHFDDFIQSFKEKHGKIVEHDFNNDDEIESAMSVVFMQIRRYVSLGELEDIRDQLPKEIKSILNTVLMI